MNVNFPPVDDGYIKAKVADGFYSNATELVRDVVRRLREQDDREYANLIAVQRFLPRSCTGDSAPRH